MNYKEAIAYLYGRLPMFSRVGAAAYKPGLQTVEELDNFFSHPHKEFKSIHVGGTNGKGSTSHLLASVLQSEGYKVGLYTSPHLVDFRERIRVNGEMISEEAVGKFVDDYLKSNYHGNPSFFELTMIMAFKHFAEQRVDFAIIEVGMGGRLDSTNIITPVCSVITNISKDHTQFLGDTLEKIAGEKAGIIKAGTPVVVGEAKGSIRGVFLKKAIEEGSEITFAEENNQILDFDKEETGWRIKTKDFGEIKCPLSGDYQIKNINTALSVIKALKKKGFKLKDESIKNGFLNVENLTGLRGRWHRLSNKPLTICDTGHNEAGLLYNFKQLKELQKIKGGTLKIIIGFVADKAIDEIINLLPEDGEYYITNALIPRALPVEDLAKKIGKRELKFKPFSTVMEAYSAALKEAKENDLIFIGGSTFIVADLLSEIKN